MKKELGNAEEEIYEEAPMCIHCGLFFKSISELDVHTEQHLIPTNIPQVCNKCNFYYIYIFIGIFIYLLL